MHEDHVDVLVVGAGLSGVCAGYHLQDKCPGKSYAILEARGAISGTWDLFRYPGVRSDSDMYTLGFRFRPWPDAKAIADGPAIREYVRDTARIYGVDEHVRLHHRVVGAAWSTGEARWTVQVERTDTGERLTMTCSWLFACTGYYRYDEGYSPRFEGAERFAGRIVHPQHWSDDVDYSGKRVVVIGSGATAVTLVPEMAKRAAHVTMLQRSPSYVVSLPGRDPIATALRKRLPQRFVYPIVRWKNVLLTMASFQLSRRRPELMKRVIRRRMEGRLPPGYEIDPHFAPRYNPWDQRLCLVPDGDLFDALCDGSASIVTDRVATFTERGIRLESGAELEADLVVTATGLNVLPLGGIAMSVDGREVSLPDTLTYKGLMLSDVPNMAFAVGYTNASWTLKCELCCEYLCRLLNHMDERGERICTPRNTDPSVEPEPLIDFNSGYVLRGIGRFPRQGSKRPWRLAQNYPLDVLHLRLGPVADEAMEFAR
ncbi:MAG TPA: NAD(P)/FAD-dependent oxidoreductase [Thermoleophilaceae bacterium]|jgi:cation diffusion facilitator CzcD-associated flavoprotein CzcO